MDSTAGGVTRAMGGAWLVTRSGLAWAAASPWYGNGTGPIRPWSDVELFAGYAERLLGGALPYADVPVEYPAGALPLVVGPGVLEAVPGVTFLTAFIGMALLLDLAGLLLLGRLATRWGAPLGPWAWIVGLVLLGPLVLLRLDLLPVVLVLWAVERAAAGRWGATGALLVAGAAAKLWPAGLLPAAVAAGGRARRVAGGAAVATIALVAASAGVLRPMLDTAVLRNLDRGLQVETLWGTVLLALDALGMSDTSVLYAAGADHVTGTGASVLVWLARLVPIGVVALGLWVARRGRAAPGARRYARAAEAATLLLVAGASVLSAQFLLWAIGAVAAVACDPTAAPRRRLVLIGAAAALTAVEFPWLYSGLKEAAPLAVTVVVVRNLLLVVAAIDATRDAFRSPTPAA